MPNITPYPLAWPARKARAKTRKGGAFWRTISKSRDVIADEVGRMGAKSYVLSSNMEAFNRAQPQDPGVALWFLYKGEWRCVAVDSYATVQANIAAIAATLESLRTVLRHGGLDIFEQAIAGFAVGALPERAESHVATQAWFRVLGVTEDAPMVVIEAVYKTLARTNHPDAGGSHAKMAAINVAFDEAKKARGMA